jgi:phage terminase large subunit-like protein
MDGPWRADLVDELTTFPAGQHDDQVDAMTHGLAFFRGQKTGPFLFGKSGSGTNWSAF